MVSSRYPSGKKNPVTFEEWSRTLPFERSNSLWMVLLSLLHRQKDSRTGLIPLFFVLTEPAQTQIRVLLQPLLGLVRTS
jgi:hypothetical protein